MKWTEGRSNGTTLVVKRSAIKSGAIAVRSKVPMVWGKSKKTHNAKVVGDGSVAQVQRANSHEDEPFAIEVVDPAPADTQGLPVAGLAARIFLPLRQHRISTYENAGRLGLSIVCCC